MKKIFIILTVTLTSFIVNSQTLADIKANENGKSGNYKDILSSAFQLASTNFTGDNKAIEFNSTLFALKAKANKSTTVNYNNYKQRFERNFQFNFKVKLDSKFKYEGFNGGITYAILNQRDKHLADFSDSELHVLFNEISNEIMTNQLSLLKAAGHSMLDINTVIAKFLRDEPVTNFTANELPIRTTLLTNLNAALYLIPKPLSSGGSVNDAAQMVSTLNALRTQYYLNMESKILWTVAVAGTSDKEGKFNKASVESIFLKGNKAAWNEIDVRAKLIYADTLLTEHLPRTSFNAKAGMNFKIGKDTKQQSYFEVKVYGEYNKIINNVFPNEKENTFFANTDIRLRLTDDLWFPITIKYDTERSNFLGFLNITYNFGGI